MLHLLAYIDPGSGSLIIQAVIATLVAIPIFFRQQIGQFLRSVRRGEAPAGSTSSRSTGPPDENHHLTSTPAIAESPGSSAGIAIADGPTSRIPIAIYPAVLAVALVAELVNVGGVSPFSAVRAWLITATAGLVLAALGRLVLGDKHRGGVLAALWVIALLGGDDLKFGFVIVGATAVMLLERYGLPAERRTIRWAWIGTWASRLAGIVALAVLIQAIQMGTLPDAWRSLTHETFLRPQPADVAPGSSDPDIYMVLLDGHTRADVLSQIFDQDESGFISGLEADGFYVAPRSRSNYTNTAETLSSMFNASHLRDLPLMAGLLAGREQRPAGGVVREAINQSRTMDLLHSRGYEVESIASGWEEVAIREADQYVDTGQINEFEIGVLRRSLLGHLLEALAPDAVSAQQRDRINAVFAAMAAAPARAGDRPRFVFAHVPSPHPPWVYHADGSPRTVATLDGVYGETPATLGLNEAQLKDGYGGQVTDIDRRMLATLDPLDDAIEAGGVPRSSSSSPITGRGSAPMAATSGSASRTSSRSARPAHRSPSSRTRRSSTSCRRSSTTSSMPDGSSSRTPSTGSGRGTCST